MTHVKRFGMTWIEWSVVISIIAIVAAILLPPVQGVVDGDFLVRFTFEGVTPSDHRLRVAIGYGHDPAKYLAVEPQPYLKWHEVTDWDGDLEVRTNCSYAYKTDLFGRVKVPEEYPRLLIAEYTAPSEPPRYRVSKFVRKRGQSLVELTVSREPPSDIESWSQ